MWSIMMKDLTLETLLKQFASGTISGRQLIRAMRQSNQLAAALVYAELKKRGVDSTRDVIKMAIRRSSKKTKKVPQSVEIPMMDATSPFDKLAVTVIGASA